MTTLSDATIRAERNRQEDEQGLRRQRRLTDHALEVYRQKAHELGYDSTWAYLCEQAWHREQQQFYAMLNTYHYLYGEVPAWVGDILAPQEDGTP